MTLIKSNLGKIHHVLNKFVTNINTRKLVGRNSKRKIKPISKIEKGNKTKDVTKKLLESCKPWGGPFTRVKEFEYILGNVILCQDTQIREVI